MSVMRKEESRTEMKRTRGVSAGRAANWKKRAGETWRAEKQRVRMATVLIRGRSAAADEEEGRQTRTAVIRGGEGEACAREGRGHHVTGRLQLPGSELLCSCRAAGRRTPEHKESSRLTLHTLSSMSQPENRPTDPERGDDGIQTVPGIVATSYQCLRKFNNVCIR